MNGGFWLVAGIGVHLRILALDIGRKRTGVAVSDATGTVASPVKVLPSEEVFASSSSFRRILEDYEPDLLVAGLPVSLDGTENEHAVWVREMAEKVAEAAGLPLELADERLSSAEAKRIMREQGMSEKDMRGKLDMVAASVFLQAYLDSRRPSSFQ